MVIDVRNLEGATGADAAFLVTFEHVVRYLLLSQDLVMPTVRRRFESPALLPPTSLLSVTLEGISGFHAPDYEVVKCPPPLDGREAAPARPVTFIANRATPSRILHFIYALQVQQGAQLVLHASERDVRRLPPGELLLLFEPAVPVASLEAAGVSIELRTGEVLLPDGTVGCRPDLIVIAEGSAKSSPTSPIKGDASPPLDRVTQAAVQLASRSLPSQKRAAIPSVLGRIAEPVEEVGAPLTRSRQLLGLVRLYHALRLGRALGSEEARALWAAFIAALSAVAEGPLEGGSLPAYLDRLSSVSSFPLRLSPS
jgi:hypothetical protein